MKSFNFRKTIKRRLFTIVFGGIGRRRTMKDYRPRFMVMQRTFWMAVVRRSYQGYRNKRFAMVSGIQFRLKYGRRKSPSNFRR